MKRTLFQRPDRIHHPLYVVTTLFNSPRYRARWKLYEDFVGMVERAHGVLYTAEIAFGDRDFAVTQPNNPRHLQLRTSHELWLKENSLNLMVQRLPLDWKYVAWIDADVLFARPDWANETLHKLQHFPVVQMWEFAQDLGPNHEPLRRHESFASLLQKDPECTPDVYSGGDVARRGHPGLAWACRRDAWDAMGGLIDFSPLGSGDTLMAAGMIGKINNVVIPDLSKSYKKEIKVWGHRAYRHIRGRIGAVPGTIFHYWHGPKGKRGYHWRWKILADLQFDPDLDLVRDWQGLWQLSNRSPIMRTKFHQYFMSRDEDCNQADPL